MMPYVCGLSTWSRTSQLDRVSGLSILESRSLEKSRLRIRCRVDQGKASCGGGDGGDGERRENVEIDKGLASVTVDMSV